MLIWFNPIKNKKSFCITRKSTIQGTDLALTVFATPQSIDQR